MHVEVHVDVHVQIYLHKGCSKKIETAICDGYVFSRMGKDNHHGGQFRQDNVRP